jgi:hypothetical protein
MTDAAGNSGGSSDIELVALSNDASCLNTNSPSSTVTSIPSSTAASSATSSPTQTSTSTTSGVSSGTIIGAAVGGVLAVTAIVALAVFYLKRHGRSSYGLAPTRNSGRPNSVELDPGMDNFQHPPIYPFPYQADSVHRLAPPVIPGSLATPASYQGTSSTSPSIHASEAPFAHLHSRTNSNTDSFSASGDILSSSMSWSGRRKAAMAGMSTYQPTRFIVHTDAEDHAPEVEPEVVELPPQYSVRRTPVASHSGSRAMSSVTGLSSTDLAYLSGQHVDEPPHSTPHQSNTSLSRR